MAPREVTIKAADGCALAASVFEPAAAARRLDAVVVPAGTGIRRHFYARYAADLAQRGLRALTFDYRGIGDSRPADLRGFEASMSDWGERDLTAVLDWIADRFDPPRLFVVGHSSGGQMVGLAANNERLRALVTVATQSGYYGHWPRPRRYLMQLLWHGLMPGSTHLCGYFPARRLTLGEDLPRGVALEWARWCRHRDFITDPGGRPVRAGFERFRAPILGYSFEDDWHAPRAAVDALLGWYVNAPVERRHLAPADVGARAIGHFGFFRPERRDTLWNDTAEWLQGQ